MVIRVGSKDFTENEIVAELYAFDERADGIPGLEAVYGPFNWKSSAEIADLLNEISEALDTAIITDLNAKVDVDGEEYEDVAAEFYESLK